MKWDYYYEWHALLLLSTWLKGFAAATWLPALAAAICCHFLKRGILGRLPALTTYAAMAGTWAAILLLIRGTNYYSPAWFEPASLAPCPSR